MISTEYILETADEHEGKILFTIVHKQPFTVRVERGGLLVTRLFTDTTIRFSKHLLDRIAAIHNEAQSLKVTDYNRFCSNVGPILRLIQLAQGLPDPPRYRPPLRGMKSE